MSELPTYRPVMQPEWIDYNGHLRDAYYGLIFSLAIDELMDKLGIDEQYRQRTHNTLYSMEMHTYFLSEIKRQDEVIVKMGIIGADKKRMHVGAALYCTRLADAAATTEFMLLHVHQGDTVKSEPFPADIHAKVDALAQLSALNPALGTASRKIQLR